MNEAQSHPGMPLLPVDRIVNLTDAMFAIAMTILVLTIEVPAVAPETAFDSLSEEIWELNPTFFSYVLSFAILGFSWVSHHAVYYYIRRSDSLLIWLNFLYLLFLVLIPFTTDLFGEYSGEHITGILYVGNVFIISLVLLLQWWYAATGRRLIDKDIDSYLIREQYIHRIVGPIGLGLAFAVAFANVAVAVGLMILTVFSHMFTRKIADWQTDRIEGR